MIKVGDYIEMLNYFHITYIDHLTGKVPAIWIKNSQEKYGWTPFEVIDGIVTGKRIGSKSKLLNLT